MYIAANTFDDLLAKVFRRLLTRGIRIAPTKGAASEVSGVLLCLNSRAHVLAELRREEFSLVALANFYGTSAEPIGSTSLSTIYRAMESSLTTE